MSRQDLERASLDMSSILSSTPDVTIFPVKRHKLLTVWYCSACRGTRKVPEERALWPINQPRRGWPISLAVQTTKEKVTSHSG